MREQCRTIATGAASPQTHTHTCTANSEAEGCKGVEDAGGISRNEQTNNRQSIPPPPPPPPPSFHVLVLGGAGARK